jgi:hypothetical protein
MPIPDSILGSWGHHYSGTAPKQAHLSIRSTLDGYKGWDPDTKYKVMLQGSYKNDTNLHQDSDVDVVVQLASRLRTQVASLNKIKLKDNQSHKIAYERWKSFHRQVLKALRLAYGTNYVTTGRKSLKLAKSKIPASADVVFTLRYGNGLAFYLPDEHRWVVSYPVQHHAKGLRKERGTNGRYKRTIRIFKSARNHLIENNVMRDGIAPSYFIECLYRSKRGMTGSQAVTIWGN